MGWTARVGEKFRRQNGEDSGSNGERKQETVRLTLAL